MGDLSYEAYSAWCRSRVPAVDPGSVPDSSANTILAEPDSESCPVTLRSVQGDRVIVTPRGSR